MIAELDRRRMLAGGGLLGAGLWLGGCSGSGTSPGIPALRASTTGKGESDMELLLKTAGLKPDGFRIDYANFQSGHLVVEALNAGSLDYGSMSEIPPVFAAASTVRSFRQIAVMQGDVNNQVVLLPKGSPVTSIADLKGKRVGYVRATTSHYFLIRMLEEVGLGWADIQPIAMTVSDGAAAFSQGAFDAWAIYGFPIQRAIATEGARVLRTALGVLSGNYIISAHVDAFADPAKVAIIGKYLRLVRQAYAWSSAHEDAWAKIVAREIAVPLEYVQDQFRRKSGPFALRPVTPAAIASQQAVADVFSAASLIPRRVDVRSLWDVRFNPILEEKV